MIDKELVAKAGDELAAQYPGTLEYLAGKMDLMWTLNDDIVDILDREGNVDDLTDDEWNEMLDAVWDYFFANYKLTMVKRNA